MLAAACSKQAPAPHGGALARELLGRQDIAWTTTSFPYGHVHAIRGSYSATHVTEFIDSLRAARDTVLRFLEVSDSNRNVEIFVVDTRADMQRMVGRPSGGMMQRGERTVLFVNNATYRPFLKHELGHLYSWTTWGEPRTTRWISEGVAAWVSGACQRHSVDEVAASIMSRNAGVDWRTLRDRFDELPELVANPEGASVVGFLRDKRGIQAVERAWGGDSSYLELEQEWRDHLARVKPAALDSARLLAQGC